MKTKTSTHTPTPWAYHLGHGKYPRFHIQTTGGYQIASTPELSSLLKEENAGRELDAAFIVRAVNCHEDLLDAVRNLLYFAEKYGVKGGIQRAQEAIAKAEGR